MWQFRGLFAESFAVASSDSAQLREGPRSRSALASALWVELAFVTMPRATLADRFTGFADPKFFRDLAKHQSRDWFLANKSSYDAGFAAPMNALLLEVQKKLDRSYPDCELGAPKVFRINRDVRFSSMGGSSATRGRVVGSSSARWCSRSQITESSGTPSESVYSTRTRCSWPSGRTWKGSTLTTSPRRFRIVASIPTRGRSVALEGGIGSSRDRAPAEWTVDEPWSANQGRRPKASPQRNSDAGRSPGCPRGIVVEA